MNIKEIVEGMTAPQVAQVIKDNFNEVDKDKANKTDLNKSISDLASVVEANKTDLTKKIDNSCCSIETISPLFLKFAGIDDAAARILSKFV